VTRARTVIDYAYQVRLITFISAVSRYPRSVPAISAIATRLIFSLSSSEIGYAGSPPREILARGRSIDSVDRPFHPSDWVDVNLEVPSPPRPSSALTNSTVDASLYPASPTSSCKSSSFIVLMHGRIEGARAKRDRGAGRAVKYKTYRGTGGREKAPIEPPDERLIRSREPSCAWRNRERTRIKSESRSSRVILDEATTGRVSVDLCPIELSGSAP